jgi:hypothetical protein
VWKLGRLQQPACGREDRAPVPYAWQERQPAGGAPVEPADDDRVGSADFGKEPRSARAVPPGRSAAGRSRLARQWETRRRVSRPARRIGSEIWLPEPRFAPPPYAGSTPPPRRRDTHQVKPAGTARRGAHRARSTGCWPPTAAAQALAGTTPAARSRPRAMRRWPARRRGDLHPTAPRSRDQCGPGPLRRTARTAWPGRSSAARIGTSTAPSGVPAEPPGTARRTPPPPAAPVPGWRARRRRRPHRSPRPGAATRTTPARSWPWRRSGPATPAASTRRAALPSPDPHQHTDTAFGHPWKPSSPHLPRRSPLAGTALSGSPAAPGGTSRRPAVSRRWSRKPWDRCCRSRHR